MATSSITYDFFIKDKKAIVNFINAIDELLELRKNKKDETNDCEYISTEKEIDDFFQKMKNKNPV